MKLNTWMIKPVTINQDGDPATRKDNVGPTHTHYALVENPNGEFIMDGQRCSVVSYFKSTGESRWKMNPFVIEDLRIAKDLWPTILQTQ